MRMISQALQGVSRTQLADAWHAARATSAAVVAWSRAVVPPVHLPQRQRQQQQQYQHMPGDRSARNRDDESLDEGTFQWAVRPKSDDLPLLATSTQMAPPTTPTRGGCVDADGLLSPWTRRQT